MTTTQKTEVGATITLVAFLLLGPAIFLALQKAKKNRQKKLTQEEEDIQHEARRIIDTAILYGEGDIEVSLKGTLLRKAKIQLLSDPLSYISIIGWFRTNTKMDLYSKISHPSGTMNYTHRGKSYHLRLAFTPENGDERLFVRILRGKANLIYRIS